MSSTSSTYRDLGTQSNLVKNGKFVLLPISDETRGHGSHTIAALWLKYLAELLAVSEKK